jgi:hypothetical protein
VEYTLDDDGAADEHRQDRREQRQHRDHRVAERVRVDHALLGEAIARAVRM